MIAVKNSVKLLYYQKFLGLFLIIIGIPVFFIDPTNGSEMPLMVGLFTMYFSLEKTEDERSTFIRSYSLTFAFIIAYTIKIVSSNLFIREYISWQLVEINHFIILVFAIALIIYNLKLHVFK